MTQRTLFTKSRLASELQIDRKRVYRLLATIPPDGTVEKRFDGWYLSTACQVLYGLDEKDENDNRDPDLMTPKERKDWYDGTDTKHKLEEKAGLVVPAEEVRRGIATLIGNIIQEIENLPDLFERDCGFDPQAVKIAQDAIDRTRELTYERVISSRTKS